MTTPVTTRAPRIQEVNFALPHDSRCARCGVEGWVEIELTSGSQLVFCGHHYAKQEPELLANARRIVDHRPALREMERRFGSGTAAR
jgi:hypothetical protein